MAMRSKVLVCGHSIVGISGFNLTEGMGVCVLCLCRYRLCDELSTDSRESSWVCVSFCVT